MIHTDEHGDWYTIPEVATIHSVQPVTIYAWTYRKNIRKHRVEGRLHVNIDDITAYIQARPNHAVESRTGR